MSRRPRLAEVLEAQRAEAERQARVDAYVAGLERENILFDQRLAELGAAEPERPREDRAAAFVRRTAVEARREQEDAEAANVAAHENPDPPRFDPIAELLAQKRDRKGLARRRLIESARRPGR